MKKRIIKCAMALRPAAKMAALLSTVTSQIIFCLYGEWSHAAWMLIIVFAVWPIWDEKDF